ncbi:phospholipid-transporting ATPase ABCA1 isoform X2 [Phycodurus eques]|uniref:phospholipid-transporting ATPase ABCA1 isoform X2 n=1 Tax=Phycodurus eques TaxID=693459 RepID=UPI002ACDC211|nr:phospholipid-transporting ATPase ABCA1 isoform X2 [Phycodurus eques]
MDIFEQLVLLLWKNITYRRRNKIQLIIELFWPLFLFLILIYVRNSNRPFQQGQCHFPNKALPSAGTLPWIQGFICNIDNPCYSSPTLGETPGKVGNFDNAIISRVFVDAQTLLDYSAKHDFNSLQGLRSTIQKLGERPGFWPSLPVAEFLRANEKFSPYLLTKAGLSPETVKKLLSANLNFKVYLTGPELQLKDLVCNIEELKKFLRVDAGEDSLVDLQTQLCNLPIDVIQEAHRLFISELDTTKLGKTFMSGVTPFDLLDVGLSINNISNEFSDIMTVFSSLSSFSDMSKELSLLSHGKVSREGFQAFSRIMCDRSEIDSKRNPSFKWYKDDNIKSIMGTNGFEDMNDAPTNQTTPFCKNLMQSIKANPMSLIVWRVVKPILIGKLLYAPDTPAVQQVMKEVNKTFKDLQIFKDLNEAWLEVGPEIIKIMETRVEIPLLQGLLQLPNIATRVNQRLEKTSWTASRLAHFLSSPSSDAPRSRGGNSTWRDIYQDLDSAITYLAQVTECFFINKLEGLTSEDQLIGRALELLEDRQFWAGVVFVLPNSSSAELPPNIIYKIRMDIDDVTRTDKIKDRSWDPGPAADPINDMRYIRGGFVYVQDLVEKAVSHILTNVQQNIGLYIQQMPYPCFVDDIFLRVLNRTLPLFLTLAWIYSVAIIIKGVVYEKEARLKETMKIMGLSTGTLWLSWFISSLVPFLLSSTLLIAVLKWGDILPYSNVIVLFFFLTAFATATITQCFLISTFFSKANMAAACGGLIYFSLYLPYVLFVAWRDRVTTTLKVFASFLSPVAFGFGSEYFSQYEEQGVGIQWNNLQSSPVEGDSYNFATSIAMLYMDAFIYAIAAWYIEAVFPGEYGVPRPWYFLFHINYWRGIPLEDCMQIPSAPAEQDKDHIEADPSNLVLGVSISNLVKIYKKGAKMAVNHLNLKFYEGQITSFLGHNGAGKTTTISVLTGLFPPTSGTVYINGMDIRQDVDTIRRTLGVCPQYNVLFDILTVEEHIWFYGRLKGMSEEEVKAELDSWLEDVGLLHKRHEQTKSLSGGMKRKLSVAIAFVGGSKVVVLDEPTAGVDPYSRRGIWDMLLKYRKDRTIILSTHYMDEAELLGDRIAIISQGRLCCCGSPLFLKSKLGSGYSLTVVKKDSDLLRSGDIPRPCNGDTGLGNRDSSCMAPLLSLAHRHFPGASLVEESGCEAVINLPQKSAKSRCLAVFLSELDQNMSEIGIISYGLSDSKLEDIFLRVAEETEVDAEPKLQANDPQRSQEQSEHRHAEEPKIEPQETDLLSGAGQGALTLTGWRLTRQQLRALFIKRWLYARRSRRGLFAQIVLPAVFVLVALLVSLIIPKLGKYPALELHPSMYGEQYTFFSNDAPGNPAMEKLLEAVLDMPCFDTKCIENKNSVTSHQRDSKQGYLFKRPQVPYSTWQMVSKGNWTKERPSPDCQCSTKDVQRMLPDCPEGAGGLPPPQVMRHNGVILQNLTSYNMSDYLVKTYSQILKKSLKTKKLVNELRYGGFSLGGVRNAFKDVEVSVGKMRTRYSVPQNGALNKFLNKLPGFLKRLDTQNNVKLWFNNKGWHAMVSFVNVLNNGLLRAGPLRQGSITAYNHPLNLTKEQLSQMAVMSSTVDVLVSVCVVFAMSFVPASFVLFLIEERASKAKHLQFVSGVQPVLYWVASFCWDMLNYAVPAFIVVLIFIGFQQDAYVSRTNLPALILLLLLYGWSITPLMYPASFVFTVPSTAYIVLTCVNLFIGINGSIATFVLELFVDEHLQELNRILKKVLLIFPHYCLGRGLMDMAKNQAMADTFQRLGAKQTLDPFQWDFVGKNLFAMAVQGVVFFIFTLMLQFIGYRRIQNSCVGLSCVRPGSFVSESLPRGPEDEDVARERKRVKSGKADSDILTMIDLTKIYKANTKPAVNQLCLGIPRGECFGLLGVNGAGKTSTFRMLTGDTTVTFGEAFLNKHSVLREMDKVHHLMGYCPQFDAICNLLTGIEHLELYARLRGVPEESVTEVAQWGVKKMGLSQYAKQEAGGYSGGNKRKLSTAIALIGAPPVIFLDEPTTGMDPKAKRFLWNCILSFTREGRAVVLTSHSMEECEALCTRMAIMVNGRFQCLGSVQHLKTRFGDGYTIIIRLTDSESNSDTCRVSNYMKNTFPMIQLKEQHQNVRQYQLPAHACCLARVFDVLAHIYEELGISDFSVSQTTLDQVFVNFAKDQTDDDDNVNCAKGQTGNEQPLDMIVSNGTVQSNLTAQPIQINPAGISHKAPVPQQQRTSSSGKRSKGGRKSRNGSSFSGHGGTTGEVHQSNQNSKDPSSLFMVDTSTDDTPV